MCPSSGTMHSSTVLKYLLLILLSLVSIVLVTFNDPNLHISFTTTSRLHEASLHHYEIGLKPRCTLEDHLSNIKVLRNETYFDKIIDFTNSSHRYFGAFPVLQVQRIRADRACVTGVKTIDPAIIEPEFGLSEVSKANISYVSVLRPTLHQTSNRSSGLQSFAKRFWNRKKNRNKIITDWHAEPQSDAVHWNLQALCNDYEVTKWTRRPFTWRYIFLGGAGRNVDIYVFSAGIRADIEEFENRVSLAEEFKYRRNRNVFIEEKYWGKDPTGIGTAVAGIVSGQKSGVSKVANIIDMPFRSPYNPTPISDRLVAGLEIMTSRHKERNRTDEYFRGSIAIVCMQDPTLDDKAKDAISEAFNSNILIVAPAGDDRGDHGRLLSITRPMFPCMLAGAFCVGAMDKNYRREPGSNYGPPVQMWAPGGQIFTAFNGSSDRKATGKARWGSTFAAAHVAGTAAIFLGKEQLLKNDPEKLILRLRNNANKDMIRGMAQNTRREHRDDWNLLVNTGIDKTVTAEFPFDTNDGDLWTFYGPHARYFAYHNEPVPPQEELPPEDEDEDDYYYDDDGIYPGGDSNIDLSTLGGDINGHIPGTSGARPPRFRDDDDFPDSDIGTPPTGGRSTSALDITSYDGSGAPSFQRPRPQQPQDPQDPNVIPDDFEPAPPYVNEDNPNAPGSSGGSEADPQQSDHPSPPGSSGGSEAGNQQSDQPTPNSLPDTEPDNAPAEVGAVSLPQIPNIWASERGDFVSWCNFDHIMDGRPSQIRKRRLAKRTQYYPSCIQQDSSLQVSVEYAKAVWDSLDASSGHICTYRGDNEPTPVIPCTDGICLYWVPGIAGSGTNGTRVELDCVLVANALRSIICKCPPPNHFLVGGSVMLPEVPNAGLVIGPQGQTFDNATIRRLRR